MSDTVIGTIASAEVSGIRDYIDLMVASGQEWLTFPARTEHLTVNDIDFFESKARATDHCWDKLTAMSYDIAMPIRLFQNAIESAAYAVSDESHTPAKVYLTVASNPFMEDIDETAQSYGVNSNVPGILTLVSSKDTVFDFSDSSKEKDFQQVHQMLQKHELEGETTMYELFGFIRRSPGSFELKFSPPTAKKDVIEFTSYFERSPDGYYSFSFFDGVLRKAIKMLDQRSSKLETEMSKIDWPNIARSDQTRPGEFDDIIRKMDDTLKSLADSGPEGKRAADNMRFRYGAGTALEKGIDDLEKVKQMYESSFRFSGEYFEMTSREAYFFLSLFGVKRLNITIGPPQFDFTTSKNTVMNSENLEFLQDNLKFLGFGEKLQLNKQLQDKIASQPKDFQLTATAKFDPSSTLDAVLHFRRSDNDDRYFFNKYDAHLKHTEDPSKDRSQTFYIDKGKGVTLKEAWNLLLGRSVYKNLTNKEGQPYGAWVKLNFGEKDKHGNFLTNRYNDAYGFNVDRQLAKLTVKEANPDHPKHAETLKSLKKGNLVEVETTNGEKRFLAANPPAGKIQVFDSAGNEVQLQRAPKETAELSQGQGNTRPNGNKNENKAAIEPDSNGRRSSQKKTSGNDDLEEAGKTRRRKAHR